MSNSSKKKITGASLRNAFEEIIWPRKGLIGIGLVLIVINRLSGLVMPAISEHLVNGALDTTGAEMLELAGRTLDLRAMLVVLGRAVTLQAATYY